MKIIENFNYILQDDGAIIFMETWLSADISNSDLELPNYDIFRADRNLINSSFSRGVLIVLKNTYHSYVSKPSEKGENLFLRIDDFDAIIEASYFPPLSSSEIL